MTRLTLKLQSRLTCDRICETCLSKENDPTPTELYPIGKNIDDDGATVLAQDLETNTTLLVLNLWNNQIDNDGAKALLETLKAHNGTLTCLDLASNNIPNELHQEIAAVVWANKSGKRSPEPIPKTKQRRSI